MKQNYEIYLAFNPNLSSEENSKIVAEITKELESLASAENSEIIDDGVKSFAYPIHKLESGHYYLLTFDIDVSNTKNLEKIRKKLNLTESLVRYLMRNVTLDNKLKAQQKINLDAGFTEFRELNKGKKDRKSKNCISTYLGYKTFDYRDKEFIDQFTSPYAKIFNRDRTGTKSKLHRKLTKAIKYARHMGLIPFTAKWVD